MHGFILIDKPVDWTSHDVVGYLRGVTKIKKIGHAGTLDPFATGLLIVAIGREATKQLDSFHQYEKTYVSTLFLGAVSDSYDKTGTIEKQDVTKEPTMTQIKTVLETFEGEQTQIPPMYSAKKVDGKKLYQLARKGIEIERKPHHITISNINLIEYAFPSLTLEAAVSTGTYIRTLCHDIGVKLKTGAYCETLRRTSIGPYTVDKAIEPKKLDKANIEGRLFMIDKS